MVGWDHGFAHDVAVWTQRGSSRGPAARAPRFRRARPATGHSWERPAQRVHAPVRDRRVRVHRLPRRPRHHQGNPRHRQGADAVLAIRGKLSGVKSRRTELALTKGGVMGLTVLLSALAV